MRENERKSKCGFSVHFHIDSYVCHDRQRGTPPGRLVTTNSSRRPRKARTEERSSSFPRASGADLGRESHGERSEHDVARLHLFGAKMFNPMVDGKPFAFCPGHGSGVTGNKPNGHEKNRPSLTLKDSRVSRERYSSGSISETAVSLGKTVHVIPAGNAFFPLCPRVPRDGRR